MISTLMLSIAIGSSPTMFGSEVRGNAPSNAGDCPVYVSPASVRQRLAEGDMAPALRNGRPRPRPAPLPCAVRT